MKIRPFVLIILMIIIAILLFSIWLVNQLVTGQTDFYTIGIALIAVFPYLWYTGKDKKNKLFQHSIRRLKKKEAVLKN